MLKNPCRHALRKALALAFVTLSIPVFAVLPNGDVDRTIQSLHGELDNMNKEINIEIATLQSRRNLFWERGAELEGRCATAALALHSHDVETPFGMAKATQIARDVIEDFENAGTPADAVTEQVDYTIQRLKGMHAHLMAIDSLSLKPEARKSLNASLALCDTLTAQYDALRATLRADDARYSRLTDAVNELRQAKEEATERLVSSIFYEDSPSFIEQIELLEMTGNLTDEKRNENFKKDNIDWDFNASISNSISHWNIWTSILALVASLALWLVLRFRFSHTPAYPRRGAYALLTFFTISFLSEPLGMIWFNAPEHLFRQMWLGNQINLLWIFFILTHIVMYGGQRIRYAVLCFLPTLLEAGFLTDLLKPDLRLVDFSIFFPMAFMLAAVAQVVILLLLRRKLRMGYRRMGLGCLALTVVCLVMSWCGHTLLATMLFYLFIVLSSLVMAYFLLRHYVFSRYVDGSNAIARYTMQALVYPFCVFFGGIAAAYWVADFFNLTTWLTDLLRRPFVDIPDLCTISISRLLFLLGVAIALNYALNLAKRLMRKNAEGSYGQGRTTVALTLGSIFAWLAYALMVIIVLHVNHTGIIAAIGGASVGLGFALRDSFENFFYGLTLMTGRARPGDIVECDGLRGYVTHVGIMSTSVETEDGPVLTLPNRQLFGRNFKNLTLNNSRELRHIVFDIDDTNDIDKARRVMLDSVKDIDGVIADGDHYVVVRRIGSGVVRLDFKVWIDTRRYLRTEPAVREAVFHNFEANGITIAKVLRNLDAHLTDSLMSNRLRP